jgi:hypothetical protein
MPAFLFLFFLVFKIKIRTKWSVLGQEGGLGSYAAGVLSASAPGIQQSAYDVKCLRTQTKLLCLPFPPHHRFQVRRMAPPLVTTVVTTAQKIITQSLTTLRWVLWLS